MSKQKKIQMTKPQISLSAAGKQLPRLLVCGGLFLLLALAALWLNWPDGGHPTASSQLVFVPAEVTAVLSDDAQPDFENSEGRRIGTQKLEIRVLSGEHRGEILPLTNYMSALFNVDVDRGDRVIVRLITREDGSYYAALFNYDRGLVLGAVLLVFCGVLAVLGGWKGIRALLGLVFTLAVIWFLLIPGLIRGWLP